MTKSKGEAKEVRKVKEEKEYKIKKQIKSNKLKKTPVEIVGDMIERQYVLETKEKI